MRAAALALCLAAATPAAAQDALDLHRLCRPGLPDAAAVAGAFAAVGWTPGVKDSVPLTLALAMALPLSGDIDPDVVANAVPAAQAALPQAEAAIAAATLMTGPDGTLLAIFPLLSVGPTTRVDCLAVFTPATTLAQATLGLTNLSNPMGSPTITTVTGYEGGVIGGAMVIVVQAGDYGWAMPYSGGLIQYIRRGQRL